jgi:hypothetical protein
MTMSNATFENATATDKSQPKVDSIVDALLDIGTAWAAHGLKMGKLALETSAMTLGKTARRLDRLAEELDHSKGEDTTAEPAPATSADDLPSA